MQPYLEKFYADHPFEQPYVTPNQYETMLSLVDKYDIKSVFEIGTWQGYTAALLDGYPQIERVKTIDINAQMDVDYDHGMHKQKEPEFYGSLLKDTNVEFEFCDCRKYKPKEGEQYDMVFIDSCHTYEYLQSDTELALKFNPKIIVWHDYDASNEEVIVFITELQKKVKNIRIINGLVYWVVNEE